MTKWERDWLMMPQRFPGGSALWERVWYTIIMRVRALRAAEGSP